jgi:hypothetical protein
VTGARPLRPRSTCRGGQQLRAWSISANSTPVRPDRCRRSWQRSAYRDAGDRGGDGVVIPGNCSLITWSNRAKVWAKNDLPATVPAVADSKCLGAGRPQSVQAHGRCSYCAWKIRPYARS